MSTRGTWCAGIEEWRFARASVLGRYEGSREKAAREEIGRKAIFFPGPYGLGANLCRPSGAGACWRGGLACGDRREANTIIGE